jgi:hypothetical protein
MFATEKGVALMSYSVQLGQRVRPIERLCFGAEPSAWEVVDIFTGSDGFGYARIRRVGTAKDFKTMSLAALTDRRRYMTVSGSAP